MRAPIQFVRTRCVVMVAKRALTRRARTVSSSTALNVLPFGIGRIGPDPRLVAKARAGRRMNNQRLGIAIGHRAARPVRPAFVALHRGQTHLRLEAGVWLRRVRFVIFTPEFAATILAAVRQKIQLAYCSDSRRQNLAAFSLLWRGDRRRVSVKLMGGGRAVPMSRRTASARE